jgi:hypothetical protein
LSYDGVTQTKFGRYAVAEPFNREVFHAYTGGDLKVSDFEPPVAVLDQEDLHKQGIKTSKLVKGGQDEDALGSCTANTTVEQLSQVLTAAGKPMPTIKTGLVPATISLTDTVASEKFAIMFYAGCTHQTGDPSQEYEPTDCGSTGLYCAQYAVRQGWVSSYKSAPNLDGALSLLQLNSVMIGMPWFNAFMEPTGTDAFIDGDGSHSAIGKVFDSGVAGGHEITLSAIEKIAFTGAGKIDYAKTVIRVRNHWDPTWGDKGSCRVHASTLHALGSQADYKQFVV